MIVNNLVFDAGRLVDHETLDIATETFTRRDSTGRVVEQRPLTADELAALTPPPDPRADLLARLDDAVLLDEIRAVVADAINGGMI